MKYFNWKTKKYKKKTLTILLIKNISKQFLCPSYFSSLKVEIKIDIDIN